MATVIADRQAQTISTPLQPRPWLKWISRALALIGTLDALYLTYSKVANVETACPANATFNCDLVQHSLYSQLGGIPIVYLGLGGYVAILVVLFLDGRVPFFTQRGPLLAFGLSLFGFLYSGYLTSIEAFVLHAWCMWCLGSAIIMTTLFVLSVVRTWRRIGMVDDDPELDDMEEIQA